MNLRESRRKKVQDTLQVSTKFN